MKKFLIILFCFTFLFELHAQKESYNWYFGENAGITFDTPDLNPITMTNSAMSTDEGCAVISDAKGKVLFYTDGITVWNRNNVIMSNGQGLLGSKSSTQSAIIVPKPGPGSIYYIITTDDAGGTNGCRYSIVDMTRQSGFGEVISKNNFLFGSSTEKLIAIRHANGYDYWILTHEWDSDVFRAFLVDSSGINTFAVFSIIGHTHKGNNNNKTGYMKASKDGTKIALVLPEDDAVEIFEFDNQKGKVLNPVYLTSLVLKDAYGVEFSPSGKKLYVSKQAPPSAIFQYDLSSWTQSGILNTQTLIVQDDNRGAFQELQIGPDNMIYVARFNKSFLARIEKPEEPGFFSDYVDSAISLKGKICKQGLPNIISNDIINLKIKTNSPVCIGDTIFLQSDFVFRGIYEWTGPQGFFSNKQNISFLATNLMQAGLYKLKLTVSGIEYFDSTFVSIPEPPQLNFRVEGQYPNCDGDSALLIAEAPNAKEYLWSTNDTTPSIYVKKSGNYWVKVTDASGCSTKKDTTITFIKIPTEIIPIGPTEFCNGDSVELMALPYDSDYKLLWSTGSTKQSITVRKTGVYTLKITSAEGCVKYDSIQVKVYDQLSVKVLSESGSKFCEGDTAVLKTNYSGSDFIYLWSTGETTPHISLSSDYSGWVYVRLKSGCGDTAFFSVKFNVKPNVFISSDKPPEICFGDVIKLTALTNNTNEKLRYLWSTGDTTKSITTGLPGRYNVIVSTDSGCSNQSFIDVNVLPSPQAKIIPDGPTEKCAGGILKLTAEPDSSEFTYLWSTGSTETSIYVNKTGEYYVVVSNRNGCKDTARISITFYDKPDVKIKADGPLKICNGNTVKLSTEKKYLKYLWNTGDTTETISVGTSGQFWVSVIDSNACEGVSDTVSVFVSVVDINIDDLSQTKFGNLCLGESKQQKFRIINNGNEAINISSLRLKNNDFTLTTEPELPVSLQKNEALTVYLEFSPKYLGNYSDSLLLSIVSPCFYQYELSVEGNGIARVFAYIPDSARPIGLKYCIPVMMKLTCGDTLRQKVDFKTIVSLDASMFLPDTEQNPYVKNTYISGKDRIFEIEGKLDSLTSAPKEVFSICGTVLLGDYIWVNVNLDDIDIESSYLSALSQSGEYEIYGVCAFEISSIKRSEPTKMNVFRSNTNGEISIIITTGAIGHFKLNIYNLTGISIFSTEFLKNENGVKQYNIIPDISLIPNGYYLVVITGENAISSVPLIIYK